MSIDLSIIKNIIFDLGGVLLNIDHDAPVRAFKKLGIDDFEQQYSKVKQTSLFVDLETGKISPDTFRKEIRNALHASVTDQEIDDAWNSILLDFPKESITLLQSLRKEYRTFLLSNTNAIHYKCFSNRLEKDYGYKTLSELMEKDYYSHLLKLRKPGLEVYQAVLNKSGLKASETLFIDDSEVNIEAAKRVGLMPYHLKDRESVVDIFA